MSINGDTPCVLIIAGSDSGGGAGIQADIKTVTMLGGHAMTAITAITAQNTLGVTAVHPVPTDMVMAQIDAVADDIGIDAVKIGMIGSAETSNRVADWLDARPDLVVVFDPVMVATSGSVLADDATIAAFSRLMARATITTPNLPELEALGGIEALQGPTLIKGGHAEGEVVVDRLVGPDGEIERWESPRIDTNATHGTGCTLASAIATGLGQHMSLGAAVARARDFVRLSLLNAPGLGAGHGPMGQQAVRNDGLFPGPALNQFSVPAYDYAASVLFYRTLGLTQIVDSPDNGYARFEALNGVTLSLHQVGGAPLVSRSDRAPSSDPNPGHDDAAAIYFESGALDAWVAWLSRKGIRFDVMPRDQDWGWREAWLLDPAGNPVCLYQAGEYRRFPPWRLT